MDKERQGTEDYRIVANKNYQYIQELNEAYLKKRLIIFYGAGLSIQLGLPGWNELIEYVMEKTIESPQQRKKLKMEVNGVDSWEIMERVKLVAQVDETRIQSLIAECIKSNQENNEEVLSVADNNYKDLADSEISFFITTNYDTFLNRVDAQCESYDIDLLNDQANANLFRPEERKKKVIYLHGHVGKESSIIITKEAVEKIYSNERWISIFEGLLNNYHILFIGVSFADKYLRNFLTKTVKNTKNSYFAITDKHVQIKCKEIIKPKNEKWVDYIREVLSKIQKKPKETVWIRVWVKKEEQNSFRESMETYLEREEGETIEFISDHIKDCVIVTAIHLKKSESIETAFDRYKTIFKKNKVKRYIIDNHGIVYFYSCNKNNFHEKNYQAVFKKHMLIIMQQKLEDDSKGYIVDRIGLEFGDADEKMFEKFFMIRCHIKQNRENSHTQPKEYSFYVDESISIKDAKFYGVEVHVSGFCFFAHRMLMESRSPNMAIASGMIAPVGGRMRAGENFTQALERHFQDDCGLLIDSIKVCNIFKTYNANIPGVSFVCTSNGVCRRGGNANGKLSRSYNLYTMEELMEIHRDGKLACTKELLLEAFAKEKDIRKATIKLRIVLWSNCCYKCQGCHHENLKSTSIIYNSGAVLESLKKLGKAFDIRQITITGGEPLQDIEQLETFLKEVVRHFPLTDVAVITNGEKLDDEVIHRFAKYKIRYKISLYGYDNLSFEAYTGYGGYKKEEYIKILQKKLQLLNERNIRFTVNIPVHKYIVRGLKDMVCDEQMQEIILKQESRIKIIDMVKPRGQEQDSFQDLYVPLEKVEREFSSNEAENNLCRFEKIRNNIVFFTYPCKNCNGYNEECFENFALTLEPNGKLLVCQNAVEQKRFNGKAFTEFMGLMKIDVEYAEYNKEYGQ